MRKRKVRFLSIRQKFMLIAAACIMLVSFSIGGIAYSTLQKEMLTMAAEKAEAIGEMSAKHIDINVLTKFKPGSERLTMYAGMRHYIETRFRN